jgi:hypothetical protein
VSKFHPIWCLVAQESKLNRKFLGGFRLLEKLDSQLSLEPRSCHLGDYTGSIRHPHDA